MVPQLIRFTGAHASWHWHVACECRACRRDRQKPEEHFMIRVAVPIFLVAFTALMAYAFYLQAKIWHLI